MCVHKVTSLVEKWLLDRYFGLKFREFGVDALKPYITEFSPQMHVSEIDIVHLCLLIWLILFKEKQKK